MGQKNFWVRKIFGVKKSLGQKFGSSKFLGQQNFWVNKNFGFKNFWWKNFLRSKIFWVLKFLVKIIWVQIFFCQNFLPLGPLFLVEVEFVCGWCGVVWFGWVGVNSNNHPTSGWGYGELWLGWGFDKNHFWQNNFIQ